MPLIRLSQTVSSRDTVVPFDLTDRGLLLGDGAFDTSLVIDGHIVLRTQHFRRLPQRLRCLWFRCEASRAGSPCRQHGPGWCNRGAASNRNTRSGRAGWLPARETSKPTLLASFTPQPVSFPAPAVRLGLSSILRNPTSPLSRYKDPLLRRHGHGSETGAASQGMTTHSS